VAAPLRVLLIDVPHVLELGLRSELDQSTNLSLIGSFSFTELKVRASNFDIDTVLIGTANGECKLQSVVREVLALWSAVNIVILSTKPCSDELATCIKIGVRGYLSWTASSRELLGVLFVVGSGGTAFCAVSTPLLLPILNSSSIDIVDSCDFTPRESEISKLVVAGKSNYEIAIELNISVKTVETHITNIFRKTGGKSRVELATSILRRNES